MCCSRYSTCLPTFWSISGSISSHSYKSGFLGIANLLRMLKRTGPMPMTVIFFKYSQESARKGLWLNPITYNLLLSTDYLLKEADHSRGGSPCGRTGNPIRKTTSPHFWPGYFLPSLESDIAKTAAEKKKKKEEEKSNFSKVNYYYLNEFDQVVEFGQRLSFLSRKNNMIAQYNEQVSSQCQST